MALSPVDPISPTMAVPRFERPPSNSPHPQQPSKRDKRRNMIMERLQELTSTFSAEKDIHYRQLLLAIQVAMSKIMEADAYGKTPLPEDPQEVETFLADMLQMRGPGSENLRRAGKLFVDFARMINRAMEYRDTDMVLHRNSYEYKMNALRNDTAEQRDLAKREHLSLSMTTRDRLINSVTMKKSRLSKDKDTTDITETNSLLLHPSQFGVANPTSPGGAHGKRSTRHRQNADDFPPPTEGTKRKRRGEDSEESPAPTRRRLENGTSTPIWMAEKNRLSAQQIDSSLYSIEKLFNEKELAMTYNAAAIAAHNFIIRHPLPGEGDSPADESSSDTAGKTGPTNHSIEDDVDTDSPTASAATMERQPSHATRSTRGGAGGPANYNYMNRDSGQSADLATAELNYPGNMDALAKQVYKLPPTQQHLIARPYIQRDPNANQPNGLQPEDAQGEIDTMKRARSFNEAFGPGKNLELDGGGGGLSLLQACMKSRVAKYPKDVADDRVFKIVKESAARYEDGLGLSGGGGEAMSRQGSKRRGPRADELGGESMSRQGSKRRGPRAVAAAMDDLGGESMSRQGSRR